MRVRRQDFVWSYLAQFFTIASGLILLPLVLRLLTKEEIGFNYIMLSVGGLVNLLDFGFSKQFGRNFSYVFGGAKSLVKTGMLKQNAGNKINYTLLKDLIHAARLVYGWMALISFILLGVFGTLYVIRITDGFELVDNSIWIWGVFVCSVCANIYFKYLNSLVRGKGQIAELYRVEVLGRILQLALNISFLLLEFGLLGVALGNLMYPFFTRYLLFNVFYDANTRFELSKIDHSLLRAREIFFIIWPTTKKIGLVFVGAYFIGRASVFISGLYLELDMIASFGIMIQLFRYIVSLGSVFFSVQQPKIAALRVHHNNAEILRIFSLSMGVFYVFYILSSVVLINLAPLMLSWMGSSVVLPSSNILVLYAVVLFLENNHSFFSSLIVTKNEVPFVKASLYSGFATLIFSIAWLEFFPDYSLLGLVLVPGLVQVSYNNWKWPVFVFREFEISLIDYMKAILSAMRDFNLALRKL